MIFIANLWISEYHKYLIINYTIEGDAIPPTPVERVWQTHMEFTKEYRDFIASIFTKDRLHITPKPYYRTNENVDALKAQYEKARTEYERLFKDDMKIEYWTNLENRFNTNNETFVNVNLFRLTAAFTLKNINPNIYTFGKAGIEDRTSDIMMYINQTNMTREKRNEVKESKGLFHWREQYPTSNMIYEDFVPLSNPEESKEEDHLKQLLLESRQSQVSEMHKDIEVKTCEVFKNGGPLFIPNPTTLDQEDLNKLCINMVSGMYQN